MPGYAEAKNAMKSTHMPCRSIPGYRSPPVQVEGRLAVDQRPCQYATAVSSRSCGVRYPCRRVPRPMTTSTVSTARRTSLTAILCYRSCGTLPLSILQATRLTCSSHRNPVSPAPRRPQTRSSHTCWFWWLCRFGGSTEPRSTEFGMVGVWCDTVDAGNRQCRHGWLS